MMSITRGPSPARRPANVCWPRPTNSSTPKASNRSGSSGSSSGRASPRRRCTTCSATRRGSCSPTCRRATTAPPSASWPRSTATATRGDASSRSFDVQAQVFAQPGFRGCAFVSALAEAPLAGRVAQAANEFRAWIRNLFTTLCVEAGAADPLELARQLNIIYDGGITAAWMDHDPSIASSSRAAQALLDAAL